MTTTREQGNIKGSILEARLWIQNSMKGKKRRPQRPNARTIKDRYIVGGGGGVVDLDGERYVKLVNGNLLLEC